MQTLTAGLVAVSMIRLVGIRGSERARQVVVNQKYRASHLCILKLWAIILVSLLVFALPMYYQQHVQVICSTMNSNKLSTHSAGKASL